MKEKKKWPILYFHIGPITGPQSVLVTSDQYEFMLYLYFVK